MATTPARVTLPSTLALNPEPYLHSYTLYKVWTENQSCP